MTNKIKTFAMILIGVLLSINHAWSQATAGTTMWAEDFSGYSADDEPSDTWSSSDSHTGTTVYSGSVSYTCAAGTGSTPKVFSDGGPGTGNNLLIYQKNGYFEVSGIPTGGATELTLSYAQSGSGTMSITCSSNVSISGSTISVASGSTFTLTFKNTKSNKNLRFDDVSVVVKTAGSGGSNYTLLFVSIGI